MRLLAIAATCVAVSTAAQAGNPQSATAEPVVVADPAPSTVNGDILVPLLAFLFFLGGASN